MKLLDRYLIKQFLQTTFFGILAFTLIFVVVDMMENLDDFIDQNVVGSIILQYYLVFIPEIIRLMLPVSVLFAALFTTGKLSSLNELTAIKAAGISMYRFMLPILTVTLLICIGAIYFSGYVVPLANKNKISIEMNYLKKNFSFSGSNIFFQDSRSRIVNISYFNEESGQAIRVSIQDFDNNDLTRMTQRIDAMRMSFDSTKSVWRAFDGSIRKFSAESEEMFRFKETEVKGLNFLPGDLLAKQQKPEEMNLSELNNAIKNRINAGNDPTPLQIEYYSRYAFAMTGLIVVLFGLPLSANNRKGGLALQVGLNILITFIYLVAMKITQAFGKNGSLNPLLTAWLVNIFFTIGAVLNLMRIKQ